MNNQVSNYNVTKYPSYVLCSKNQKEEVVSCGVHGKCFLFRKKFRMVVGLTDLLDACGKVASKPIFVISVKSRLQFIHADLYGKMNIS